MSYISLLSGLLVLVTIIISTALVRRNHRRQALDQANRTERLRIERLKLVAESGNMLAKLEEELPESLKSPEATPRSPVSPLGIILTDEARNALRKRREISNRISAIDHEMRTIEARNQEDRDQ